jgi:ABC-type lipoprotein release transport system permease subunit
LLSSLAAWRVSLQRMRADWPIVVAAWLITLLAATLLAAGPIYSDAVSLAGLRRTLADAPTTDANIAVTALAPGDQEPHLSVEVERQLRGALGSLDAQIERSGESDTFALPDQPTGTVRDLATLGFMDDIGQHASLVAGSWPVNSGPSAPIEVAVPQDVADDLGWSVGTLATLTNRRDESRTLDVTVSGTFAVDDPGDPFWWDRDRANLWMSVSSSYRTFGPLITTPEATLQRAVVGNARLAWHAFPAFGSISLEEVGGVRARVAELPERVQFALADAAPATSTDLDQILATAERSLLVSRAGVLLITIQLAIVAAYAIVLTAGLLADHRRLDTALLRSRGAGSGEVVSMALAESLTLAATAALLAPFLAAGALQLLNWTGPLAATQVHLAPQLSVTAFVVAGGAALAAALLMAIPAFMSSRSFAQVESGRSRFETRTFGQRLGVDIALLAVTIIGFWQLRLYGAPLTQSVRGALGLDPLLIAAPAIGLLAGAVVALRIVPLLARGAEALTRQGRRLVGSLGAQQVARRPLRYTRSALLLMLAVSMGVFAISYADTWQRSQDDQASFQVGADVRVTTPGGAGTVPPWALRSAMSQVDGVTAVMPVERDALQLPGASSLGEIVGIDPSLAADVVRLRPDLTDQPLGELLQPLLAARPAPGSLLSFPEAPTQVRVEPSVELSAVFRRAFDPQANGFVNIPVEDGALDGRLVVGAEIVLRDASGIATRFTQDPVPYQPGLQSIVIPMAPASEQTQAEIAQIGGSLSGPVQVLAIDITVTLPENWFATGGHIQLSGLSYDTGDGSWQAVDMASSGAWSPIIVRNQGPAAAPSAAQQRPRTVVLDGLGQTGALIGPRTNLRPPAISFMAYSLGDLVDAPLEVLVNDAFLNGTAARIGDDVTVRVNGQLRQLQVAGRLAAFPATDTDRPVAVADMSTMQLLRFVADESTVGPTEWWLATDPGQGPEVAGTIAAGPYTRGEALSLAERAQALSSDPVALGIIGALSLGFVVAGLFAAIGLVVSASVSARQRRTEFALLRALGLSSRQLSAWLWLENAAMVGVSLVAGVGLGLLIGWVALPFVTVTQQAAAPFPPAVVRTDWLSIGLLAAVSTLSLVATIAVLGQVLRRIGIGSVLRMGED